MKNRKEDLNIKKSRTQLKWQMMNFLIGIIILVILIETISFSCIKKIMVQQYSDSAKQSVIAVAENMDYILENIENQTNAILLNHEMIEALHLGNKKAFITQLNSYFVVEPYIKGVYILNDYGYWYAGTEIYGGKQKFQKELLEDTQGEIKWLPTRVVNTKILSGIIPKKCFSLGRKIIDANSLEPLGYMAVEVSEENLRDTYESIYEEGCEIFIVDEEGRIISSRQEEVTPNIEMVQEMNPNTESGFTEYVDKEREYIAIYASCNKNKWKIIKTIPKDILYKETVELQHNILLFSMIGFSFALFIGYIYCAWITTPINKMMKQMKRVEKGELKVKVDTHMNNEFGQLGESFNHMVERLNVLMEQVVQEERNKKELELEVLHAQINPHFLYNTLSTIRFMAKIKGENKISDAILALTRLLRVSISFGKEMIPLKEEIKYVENYLLIQRLRFNQRFELQYEIDEECGEILVPKLILQPIVENSLLYGMENIEEVMEDSCLKIHIYSKKIDKGVELIVEDNGTGMTEEVMKNIFREEENIERFSKVGLNNVNHRLKLYYGEEYGLFIESKVGVGTKIHMYLKT